VALCKTYGVRKLAVFGSAVRGDFDPATSDVDFVLEFEDDGPGVGRRFMRLAVALEDLLQRRVDLVFESVAKDPDFLAEISSTQEVLYDGAKVSEAAAQRARLELSPVP
jgi:predicted nucleotidyltransferase